MTLPKSRDRAVLPREFSGEGVDLGLALQRDLPASERTTLALVIGILFHLRPEGGLIGEFAGMAVEIRPLPLLNRPADVPAAGEIEAPLCSGQHGEGIFPGQRGEKPFRGAAELFRRDAAGCQFLL